jgi:hypothetical protein
MKRQNVFFVLTLVITTAIIATPVAGQEKERQATTTGKGEQEKMAPEWLKETVPGEHHKHLEALTGKWNQTIKMRSSPDAEWTESKGVAEYKSVLGGRFVVEEVKCEVFGQPFEWMGFLGYDNSQKKHTAVWVDNFGTGMEYAEGQCDPAGKVITYIGEQDDPMTGSKSKYKWVITVESKDKMRIDMHEIDADGKESNNMQIVAVRAL